MESNDQKASRIVIPLDTEENPEGGSLQLGGEPEERHDMSLRQGQPHAIQPPSRQPANPTGLGLGGNFSLINEQTNHGLNGERTTSRQQQQYLLHQFKSASPPAHHSNAHQTGQTHHTQATSFSDAGKPRWHRPWALKTNFKV